MEDLVQDPDEEDHNMNLDECEASPLFQTPHVETQGPTENEPELKGADQECFQLLEQLKARGD